MNKLAALSLLSSAVFLLLVYESESQGYVDSGRYYKTLQDCRAVTDYYHGNLYNGKRVWCVKVNNWTSPSKR